MNNKFKRFNKILMMTVAILLCFVLISTSVVSGIFAKYVITKSAGATVSLKAFGVTLTVDGGSYGTIKRNPTANTSTTSTLSVTVSGVEILPGDTLDDVVKFTIGGDPNVDSVKLKVKVKVEDISAFNVTTTKIKSITPDTTPSIATANYMPIGFSMKTGTSSSSTTRKDLLKGWTTPTDAAALATSITGKIISECSFSKTGTTTDTAEKVIYENDAFTMKYVSFGFTCWGEGSSNLPGSETEAEANLIQTYLSQQNATAKLIVTYTVSLEQVV